MTESAGTSVKTVEETPAATAPPLQRRVGFLLGTILFVLILALPTPQDMRVEAKRMAAVTALMACWWIGEALPLGVTALIPLVAYPLLKIMSSAKVAPNYTDHCVFLLLGGFFIAFSMQRWDLHKRIALWIIRLVGTSARRLVLGFMLATGFVSMWISNSATAMMMMPIGLALIVQVEGMGRGENDRNARNFATCLMLGIAYASSIGGVGTLVGTPPNIIFVGMFRQLFPGAPEVTFFDWLKVGVPLAATFIPIAWLYMVLIGSPIKGQVVDNAEEIIAREMAQLGSMKRGEAMALGVFVATALLWIFRTSIEVGSIVIPGWADLLGIGKYVHDATVAMAMGLLCFLLPVDRKKGVFLLDWEHASGVPWDILLLFGGGFAIAAGFEESGLTEWAGTQLQILKGAPLPLMVVSVAMLLTFLTELTSNTAAATMTLPILAALARALPVNPLLLMVPGTIAASLGFMMPMGTPPNAIVFASGRVSISTMAKTGFVLNLIGVALVAATVLFVAAPLFGISLDQPPAWLK